MNVRVEDLIQFLFKRLSAVADQLQTNFSQEFRKIMKAVMRPVSDMRAYEVSFPVKFLLKYFFFSFPAKFPELKQLRKKLG